MTIEQKNKYLESFGKNCPFCESIYLEQKSKPLVDNGSVIELMYCKGCKKTWHILMTLY